MARMIHEKSGRSKQFVKEDVGALTETLLKVNYSAIRRERLRMPVMIGQDVLKWLCGICSG